MRCQHGYNCLSIGGGRDAHEPARPPQPSARALAHSHVSQRIDLVAPLRTSPGRATRVVQAQQCAQLQRANYMMGAALTRARETNQRWTWGGSRPRGHTSLDDAVTTASLTPVGATGTRPTSGMPRGPSALRLDVRPIREHYMMPGSGGGAPFHSLIYLETGAAAFRLGSNIRRMEAGDALLIPCGSSYEAVLPSAGDGVVVTFMNDVLTVGPGDRMGLAGDIRSLLFGRADSSASDVVRMPQVDRPDFVAHVDALRQEIFDQDSGYQQAARSYLTLLLIAVARRLVRVDADRAQAIDPVVADVFAEIDARYAEPLSLRQVADAVCRSPGHLTRVIRELTGRTVVELIEDKRMEQARIALLETNLKIEAVATAVGYRDPSYFRRRFRRTHGAPPQVWRQLNR